MTKPGTKEVYEYEDRRQEIVFIGHRMKEAAIQESGLKYFKVAIDALFKNWTALQMLVGTGAGGPQSREKAEWMTGVTENWFYENKDLEVYEVSVFLDEILINEFNVSVDDGSLEDVARSICEFFSLCQNS